jgi:hypothetical protein
MSDPLTPDEIDVVRSKTTNHRFDQDSYTSNTVKRLVATVDALTTERDEARARLTAAHAVIRRADEWEYLPADDVFDAVWTPRDPVNRVGGDSDEPVTDAEAAEIEAACRPARPTDPEETP